MRKLYIFVLGLVALASTAVVTKADTYTYTGSKFSNGNSITGSFTVNGQLGDNLNDSIISAKSFSFSDGWDTISSSIAGSQQFIDVSTDAYGNITDWTFEFYIDTPSKLAEIESIKGAEDFGGTAFSDERSFNTGTWSDTTTPAVPEPASLSLFGTGMLMLVGGIRKKFTSNQM